MKQSHISILHLKFIGLYLIFGFLCIFTTATLTTQLVTNRLKEDVSRTLYREATMISKDYLPSYFTDNTPVWAVQSQLAAMRLYLGSSLWFVNADGTMIVASNLEKTSSPEAIENFDPAETGGNQYISGTYHDYFKEEMITVIAPVIQKYSTRGYLLIHSPVSEIEERCNTIMIPVYISLGVIFLLSLIFLIGLHFFVYRPLKLVSEAARQYATGNLTYEIPVTSHDEMGDLSASLNYMAAQLKDMEDYQKKIVANVSHDFRSPLTSIKGYLEAMSDGTIPPELYEKYLGIILFETERLTDLTRDLLTLNEFDTKELLLDKTRFDVQEMIKHTAASFEAVCKPRHLTIELLMLPGSVMVYADRRKIDQVLYNLIDNALKFSENDSSVTIEVVEKSGKIFVSVKDRGIGIPKKELNKIWERFYKSDLSRGKDKKGTGLGLSIVREVIQAHDEHINVVSTEGVGTEFIFTLRKA